MIDFRYHVVSIVAVFLALATGLVLGASLLNTPLITGLDSANDALIADKEDLRDEVTELQSQRDALADSVAALSPFALFDQLAGQQVVLVQLPGADDAVATALTGRVEEAGGAVTGVVLVREEWTAAADVAVLDELVSRLTQPGVQFAEGDDPYGRAATLLANALVAAQPAAPPAGGTQPPGSAGVDPAGRETILQGLIEAEFIEADPAIAQADVAIVIAAPPLGEAESEAEERADVVTAALIELPVALDLVGQAAVLVGPAAAARDDGLLAVVRGDDTTGANVSTVDSVDQPIGPAATVLALSKELAGINGHYGLVDAADGPVPPFATVAGG